MLYLNNLAVIVRKSNYDDEERITVRWIGDDVEYLVVSDSLKWVSMVDGEVFYQNNNCKTKEDDEAICDFVKLFFWTNTRMSCIIND